MPTVVQFRRGTTSENNNFTGSEGEISIDTSLKVIRVHDGATEGGFPLAGTTAVQTLTNKTIDAPVITGTASFTTGLTAGSVQATTIGNVGATLTGTIQTASQPNITSLGILTGLSVSGNVSVGNLTITGTTTTVNSTVVDIADLNITVAKGAADAAAANGAGLTVDGAGATLTYASSGDKWAMNKSLDTAGLTVSNKINATAHNTIDIGSSGTTFATVYAATFSGVSNTAKYADLAEKYVADAEYAPGTVVVFGGEQEITVTTISHDSRVAGVISTDPAYLMNSECAGLPVAFTGRVPCLVQGPVAKGDLLVTGTQAGVAQKIDNSKFVPGCVLGKALESLTDTIATIEVAVGRY